MGGFAYVRKSCLVFRKNFILLKKIPRVKDAKDWLLTWSPGETVAEVPKFINDAFEKFRCSRSLSVIEDTGELHILFTTSRSFNSDYKWWKSDFGELAVAPAFDIKYHDNFCGAIGYLLKKHDTTILGCVNISKEQVEYGKDVYQRGLRRQRVRAFMAENRIIHPRAFDAAIGAYLGEGCPDRDLAVAEMVRDGFMFAGSGDVDTVHEYCNIYRRRTLLQKVHEDVNPSKRIV